MPCILYVFILSHSKVVSSWKPPTKRAIMWVIFSNFAYYMPSFDRIIFLHKGSPTPKSSSIIKELLLFHVIYFMCHWTDSFKTCFKLKITTKKRDSPWAQGQFPRIWLSMVKELGAFLPEVRRPSLIWKNIRFQSMELTILQFTGNVWRQRRVFWIG